MHLFYPVGATHEHARLGSGAWTQLDVIDANQLFVEQGRGGKIYALGGTPSPQLEGYSYLAVYAFPNVMLTTPLWQAKLTATSHSFAVSADGWPGMAFDTGSTIRQSHQVDSSRWDPMDIDTSHRADAIATTAGADATVFAHVLDEHDLRVYRKHDGAYVPVDRLALDTPTSIDATTDAQGAAHACIVAGGTITHVQLEADGTETITSLGEGEQCAMAVDAAGAVHLLVRAGESILHGTR